MAVYSKKGLQVVDTSKNLLTEHAPLSGRSYSSRLYKHSSRTGEFNAGAVRFIKVYFGGSLITKVTVRLLMGIPPHQLLHREKKA